jgi:AcrR family transcriptional regulator
MAASDRSVMAEPEDDPILDAARATVLDVGVKRTTVSEVARRARLSRMTVYRRYPDGAALIRALMAREFGSVLERAGSEAAALAGGQTEPRTTNARARVVAAAIRTVELMQGHPLLLRLLELEPELLLPYVTEKVGRFQELARAALAAGIAEGQRDGSIRDGDPEQMAAALETAARGFVFAAPTYAEGEAAAALAELQALADAYLRPE